MKHFCLPFNGDSAFILDYCHRHNNQIHEVYGAEGIFATGRFTNNVDNKIIANLIPRLKDLDVEFNYLVNSISVKNYIAHDDKLLKHLEKLKHVGLNNVTVSHPFMLKPIKELGFKVSTSLVQNIKTIEDKNWAEYFGYSRIICSDDLNRRISDLKKLILRANVPVEIVVNNMCLPSCPVRHSHYGFEAYIAECGKSEKFNTVKKVLVICRKMWGDNPTIFLKSSWIRPEDIKRFIDIGVKYMKIAGRDRSSESLRQTFDIYLSGEYQGFVFDYLLPGKDPLTKYGLHNIENKKLNKYFDYIFSFDNGCSGDCDFCNFCDKYLEHYL